jgi:hypothetical protein
MKPLFFDLEIWIKKFHLVVNVGLANGPCLAFKVPRLVVKGHGFKPHLKPNDDRL